MGWKFDVVVGMLPMLEVTWLRYFRVCSSYASRGEVLRLELWIVYELDEIPQYIWTMTAITFKKALQKRPRDILYST